jgi:hypothetical protein
VAYLNQQGREDLVNELKQYKFMQAKGRARRKDPESRLVFWRNAQGVGRLLTRYDLPTLGTRVTLVEGVDEKDQGGKIKADYQLVEVIAEPLPGNNT